MAVAMMLRSTPTRTWRIRSDRTCANIFVSYSVTVILNLRLNRKQRPCTGWLFLSRFPWGMLTRVSLDMWRISDLILPSQIVLNGSRKFSRIARALEIVYYENKVAYKRQNSAFLFLGGGFTVALELQLTLTVDMMSDMREFACKVHRILLLVLWCFVCCFSFADYECNRLNCKTPFLHIMSPSVG